MILPENFKVTQDFIEGRPLSASSLKAFRKSPKHYLDYLQKPFEASDAMNLGSLVDVLALSPEQYDRKFLEFIKPNLRTNDGKAEMQKLLDTANEKHLTLVTPEQIKTAKICVESLMSYSVSRTLIENKRNVQKQLKWRNKATDLPLIGYQDFESTAWETDFIVDLKTANNGDPEQFSKDAAKWDYEIQAAGYLDAHHKLFYRFPSFIFLVVETSAPFNVSVNFCESDYTDRAKDEFLGTLRAFRYAMDNYPDFKQGYEFRLFGTKQYFAMNIPRYKQQVYHGFD